MEVLAVGHEVRSRRDRWSPHHGHTRVALLLVVEEAVRRVDLRAAGSAVGPPLVGRRRSVERPERRVACDEAPRGELASQRALAAVEVRSRDQRVEQPRVVPARRPRADVLERRRVLRDGLRVQFRAGDDRTRAVAVRADRRAPDVLGRAEVAREKVPGDARVEVPREQHEAAGLRARFVLRKRDPVQASVDEVVGREAVAVGSVVGSADRVVVEADVGAVNVAVGREGGPVDVGVEEEGVREQVRRDGNQVVR